MNVEIKRAIELVGAKKLAMVSGKSLPAIYAYCCGSRGCPADVCVAIERATGGQVTRKDLRPNDWQDIWPELSQSLSNQGLGQDAGVNSLADKPELAEKGE